MAYASDVADVPRASNPSCFGTVEDVASFAANVAARVDDMVVRMIGPPPPSPEKTSGSGLLAQVSGDGLFGNATRSAGDIRTSMQRIIAALDRLDGQLP